MIIQIYAYTNADEASQAAEAGVDHIGFVAGDYGLVHAELSFRAAREIAEAIGPPSKSVALTMATDPTEILRMCRAVRPDIVHISSDLMDLPPLEVAELRRSLPPVVRLMKAVPVEGEGSLGHAASFAPVVDFLLLDSKVAGMPGVGATGRTHDWSVSRRIVREVDVPVILAGGLTPDNVAEAIRIVRPWGVDSNTGTNLPGDPVHKDPQRVLSFVRAARGARPDPP